MHALCARIHAMYTFAPREMESTPSLALQLISYVFCMLSAFIFAAIKFLLSLLMVIGL